MTTATDPNLLDAAAAIVEGRPVDWDALAAHSDAPMLACLKDIAALAGAPEREPGEPVAEQRERWAHLLLGEEIGRGSSGVVYRATDPLLRREVALKLCITEHAQAALLHEAQAMARVEHPGVLKVHGATEFEGRVGFWSELVEGENLAELLRGDRRLGTGATSALGIELCAALAAIHAMGAVHGDVKAQNVVRRADGSHVLIDFGSSVATNRTLAHSGTPLYLPPERLVGAAATIADDLYSLGILLFRALGGRFPFEASSIEELRRRHAAGDRVHLFDLRPDAPPLLLAAIERAIVAPRERRFRSAGEFAAELHKAMGAVPPATRSRWRRRGLTALAIVAFTTFAAWISLPWSTTAPPFQARLLKSSGSGDAALLDGDRLALGDTLALDLELSKSSYVYVVDEDAQGRVFQLFPLAGAQPGNPLPATQRLRLPGTLDGRRYDWQISSSGGRERVYVVVASRPLDELDPQRGTLTQARRDAPIDRSAMLAAQSPERGIGRLAAPMSTSAGDWPFGIWLTTLSARHPDLRVRRFELENP